MADSILRLRVQSEEYDNKLKRAAEGIRHLADVAHKGGGELTGLEKAEIDYIKALGDMETKSRSAAGQARELENAFKELTVIYNNLNEVEKADEGGKALAASLETLRQRTIDAKSQLDAASQSLKVNEDAGNENSSMLEQLAGKFTVNIDAIKLFNLGLKASKAVLDVAKDAFFNNEENLDEWGRTVESCESVYRGFLNSINTGDISGFLSNIQTITQAARDAYDALDELATFNAFNKANVSGARADLSGAIADFREGNGDKDAVSKASEALIKELQTKQKLQEEAYKKVIAKVASERGVNESDLMKVMTGNYGTFKELKELQYTGRKTTMVATGGTFTSGPTYRQVTEAVPANEREKLAQAIKHLNDTEIDNFQSLAEAAKMTEVEINNQRKMVARVLNGKQGGSSGSGGGSGSGGKGGKTTPEYIPLEGSIDAQTKKVQDLQKAWRAAADDTSRADIKKQIEQAQLVLDAINGKTKTSKITITAETKEALEAVKKIDGVKIEPKSFTVTAEDDKAADELRKMGAVQIADKTFSVISDIGDTLEKVKAIDGVKIDPKTFIITAETTEALAKIQEINGIKIQPKKLEVQVPKMADITPNGLTGKARTPEDLQQGAVKMKQAVQLEIDQETSKVDAETLKTLMKDAIQNSINGMDLQFGILGDKIGKGIDIPDDSWQGILDQYNALREMIGEEPIVINFKTGKIDKVVNETEKLKKTIGTTAQVVGTIGQAFNAIEDPAAKVAGTVAQAIANIAMAYSDALAKDQTTKFNIWGFIAAAAASTISMATTIAAIHSQTGYAEGGIVKGNHYSGDMLDGGSFGINAGELVLNRSQQGSLASQLEGGGLRNLRLSAEVQGEKIVLVANRYFRRTGQGEIVTWK